MIETNRLLMRQIEYTDWEFFYNVEKDASVQEYVSDINTEETIRERFESRLPSWNKMNSQWLCLVITLKETGEKIGVSGFYPEWEPYQQAEVGFLLASGFQGEGYGKESLIAVLGFVFDDLSFHKVKATVTEGNDASCGLLRKVGFQQEGLIRDNYKIQGAWKNDIVFGLLRNELVTK